MKKKVTWGLAIGMATCFAVALPMTIVCANPEEVVTPIAQQVEEMPKVEQQSVIGQIVTSVNVKGNSLVDAETIMAAGKLKTGDTLTQEGIAQDLQTIYELGFFYDVGVDYVMVPEGVQVHYVVKENPILKEVEIIGNTVYSTADIKKVIDMPKDKIINSKTLNKNVRTLESIYNEDGFILARVSDIKIEPSGILKLTINEGTVEGYVIKGNKKTKERVITREMRTKVGEPFNVDDARRSIQRVHNLGYFEDVNIKMNPGRQPNAVEVEITVAETNTGTFGIGAGYSQSDGFVGIVSVGDNNFLGIGDKANLRWEFGGVDNKNFEFTYYKPWLDRKETAIGLNVYHLTNEYQEYYDNGDDKARYDKQRKGFDITLSRPESEYVTNYLTYKDRTDTYIRPVEKYEPQYYRDNPSKIPENFGSTRSFTLTRISDTRDNIYNPSKGKRYLVSAEFAGLGSDFSFNKYSLDTRWYMDLEKERVLAFRFLAGYATGTMPLNQRFAVGGADTLRGYKDDIFRGYKMLAGTVEYRVPLAKKVQGVIFGDAGYAWDKGMSTNFNDIKYSYGVGLRINSPLGPVRLDYGRGKDSNRVHFSFGGQF